MSILKSYQLMKEQYEELCEMIRGSSPNWTHKETLDRCAAQVDALIAAENPDKYAKLAQTSMIGWPSILTIKENS